MTTDNAADAAPPYADAPALGWVPGEEDGHPDPHDPSESADRAAEMMRAASGVDRRRQHVTVVMAAMCTTALVGILLGAPALSTALAGKVVLGALLMGCLIVGTVVALFVVMRGLS